MSQDQQSGNTRLLLAVLGRDGTFITARELHQRVHRLGRPMGVSTVYRALRDLVRWELVDVLVGERNQRWYRHCSSWPHHHLVCSVCHATVEIPAHTSALPTWVPEETMGFTDVVVRVTITGVCAECEQPRSCCG
ncbi:Fur family transcriptional regulator [Lentzea flaviverrucosa]|uniref:Fur family transcriptional regulator, ferric uptake regulator n=1 Tax=Lentzea flaviverrucosa TaxID=200379 RepID=A0A1H9F5I3_9PSEU|nr:transcriptional repressor [Lentzea flaviverrucosa]RDI35301.1 Fur family ferric uptake transcriptional regulator [Lentzea flaviverrucosa]SEQ33200.1 Fur family transcriptional regulator, ferric uptake regulator [Lentzea flaviverrucosa]